MQFSFKQWDSKIPAFFKTTAFAIISLVVLKSVFQLIIVKNGLRWLTADDYCRTVISYEWLHNPRIYAGVWLSMHFWINGLFIAVFRDMTLAPIMANTFFSILTLIYFYKLLTEMFNKTISYVSCMIFSVFPFQVWLSISGMPESIFFFFVTAAVYYFIKWYQTLGKFEFQRKNIIYFAAAIVSLNFCNLLRYEGWLFSITFIILTVYLSYRKLKLTKNFYIFSSVSVLSVAAALWWMYLNYSQYGHPFYFIEETTRIFKDLNNAGLIQRVVQYPFFIFYIAPVTTALGLWKIYLTMRKKKNGFTGNFPLVRIYLLFNLTELLLLMLTGIFGSGGTNMISRYIVLNSIMLFPFAVWQVYDLRRYIFATSMSVILIGNIIWCFYYQPAYREDTYEVADLTHKLMQRNYFEPDDKIYFERVEGYYDLFPLQVISNSPDRFTSDTIPTYFPPNIGSKKQTKKKPVDQQKLNILELRKFLEAKKIKLFIARSDLLIDKLRKLSYMNEQIGDYRVFYLNDEKLKAGRTGNGSAQSVNNNGAVIIPNNTISFGRKLILKDFKIDNSNFGLNPQTVSLRWNIADLSILDSLQTEDDEFGNYKIRLELANINNDSTVYDIYSNVFSERNVEEYFENNEFKNILILKPFALLNYSQKFKISPFESGLYDLRLYVTDENDNNILKVYKGDSLYTYLPDSESDAPIDSTMLDFKIKQSKLRQMKENYMKKPFYPLGRIIAMFPNVNYTEILRKSKDLSQLIIRNGLMLPFLHRYQGDHFLNIVFT
ncbi:MAG: ArnT family glycosyltransferase, partial [Ignavibacteria bacterium]